MSKPNFVFEKLFCIRLPHFVQIGARTVELWRYLRSACSDLDEIR